jgi:hypothetical protein
LVLVPAEAKEGDQVVLAKGGSVPLVLRGVVAGSGEREDAKAECVLVGEAYVHGFMSGEAFDESRCEAVRIR